MIIQCDKCGTKFELADEKIGDKGARVRCSKCKSVFTVKKPEATQEEPKAPPPPPQQESSPAKPPGAEEDPFSDFSFNDDLDFSEGDEEVNLDSSGTQGQSVPPPPEAGGEDLLGESPDVSFSKPAPAQEDPSIGDDFDFPESDFDFSDDADTDEPAASSSASEPPPQPPGAGGPADSRSDEPFDDFGDISFDEESFSDGGPQDDEGGGESPDVDEYGNVSLSDVDKDPEKPSGMEDFDDLDSDFQFDSGGEEEESMDMDVEDFVRSSKSRAPVSDDYEASISESEAEGETPRQRPAAREEDVPPPPPKPVVKTSGKKKSHGLRNFILVVLVLFLAVGGGVLFYTNSKGWFTFEDLTSGNFGKLAEVPEKFMLAHGLKTIPLKGELKIDKNSFDYEESVKLNDGNIATVIRGKVENNTNKTMASISVEVPLLDQQTEEVIINDSTGSPYVVWSYCGKTYSKEELGDYSQTAIELEMHEEPVAVPSEESCEFMLVIPYVPNSMIDPGKISIRDREVEPDKIQ